MLGDCGGVSAVNLSADIFSDGSGKRWTATLSHHPHEGGPGIEVWCKENMRSEYAAEVSMEAAYKRLNITEIIMTAEEFRQQQEQDWYAFVDLIGNGLVEVGAAMTAACVWEVARTIDKVMPKDWGELKNDHYPLNSFCDPPCGKSLT
jgi:hypothetical protein